MGIDPAPTLGLCCMCGWDDATIIVMLTRRSPTPGHGWGCVVCDLPLDGAMAVLCEKCEPRYRESPQALAWACTGYPATEGRTFVHLLPEDIFQHDLSKHTDEI